MFRTLSKMVMARVATVLFCSFLIVLAAVRLSVLYHDYILNFKNGLAIEVGTYILLITFSVWRISKFRISPHQTTQNKVTEHPPQLRKVASHFAQGFLSGFF